MVASYTLMFICLLAAFVAHFIHEQRRKKTYYGTVDEMDEQELAEEHGARGDGEIRVIQTTDPETSATIIKVFMVKMQSKNSPSSQSASPISPLFKRDCIFQIHEDSVGIDPIQLHDSLKYQVISVFQQLCENNQLSPQAEVELANYVMVATKSQLEKALNKKFFCYGYIVEKKKILMASSDNESLDVISKNVITMKFCEPIDLMLYFHQVHDVPAISQ